MATNSRKDPYKPTLEGIGYLGEGLYKTRGGDGVKTREYTTWRSMIKRCYGKSCVNSNNKCYKGVVKVCEEWLNFQTFAKWFHDNYVDGWELDKDFLNPDAKEYSPDNCVFLPPSINKALIGSSRVRDNQLPMGVTLRARSNKFFASLYKKGKRVYLGYYNTAEEAGEAYQAAKNEYLVQMCQPYKDLLDERVLEKCKELLNNSK